jgi:hypothetical protein
MAVFLLQVIRPIPRLPVSLLLFLSLVSLPPTLSPLRGQPLYLRSQLGQQCRFRLFLYWEDRGARH